MSYTGDSSLPFEIMTNDKLEAARTGNWFSETPLAIARLDKLARDEDVQALLRAREGGWDLGHLRRGPQDVGILLRRRGQIYQTLPVGADALDSHSPFPAANRDSRTMAKKKISSCSCPYLDGDRFEGRFRDGVHTADVSDLMRRMVKEKLFKFDATPLFPETSRLRRSLTSCPTAKARLYRDVTDYVREEFNRAEALQKRQTSREPWGLRSPILQTTAGIIARGHLSVPSAAQAAAGEPSPGASAIATRLTRSPLSLSGERPRAGMTKTSRILEDAPGDGDCHRRRGRDTRPRYGCTDSWTSLKPRFRACADWNRWRHTVRAGGDDKKWQELADLLNRLFTSCIRQGTEEPFVPSPSPEARYLYRTSGTPSTTSTNG